MRNSNRGETATIAIPTTRVRTYFEYPHPDSALRLDFVSGVVGEYFLFSAVDTTKGKDVPAGLSDLHRKTPDGAVTGRF